MPFKQQKERPWSEKMYSREKYRSLYGRSNEPKPVAMASVETIMLGAICSSVALAAIGAQLGQA
jgi:hypothetical protein